MANKKISALPVGTQPLARTAPIPTVQSGVTVKVHAEDVAGIYQSKVSIASADVLTLGSIPVLGIAAPGVGYAIRVIAMSVNNPFNTTPYSAENLSLITDTATRLQFIVYYILSAIVAMHEIGVLQDINSASGTQIIENKDVYISTFSGSDPTGGDSDLDVYFTYEIIAL